MVKEITNRKIGTKSRRTGFSLIELLVVMVIISILAIFAIPSLYSLVTAKELSVAARDLSNHLVLARSEAISRQTLTRFLVATTWPETEGILCRYSIWRWNHETSLFDQTTEWFKLPEGIIFEQVRPDYLLESGYAANDATTVSGEFALDQDDAVYEATVNDEPVETRFIEFLPTGAARIPGGISKNILYSLIEGHLVAGSSDPELVRMGVDSEGRTSNWAQINVETLTGRISIYRP